MNGEKNVEFEFEEELIRLVYRHLIQPNVRPDTPMQEVRTILDGTAPMLGRLLGIVEWGDNPISGDLLMHLRAAEEEARERMRVHAERYRPGGAVREIWVKRGNEPKA